MKRPVAKSQEELADLKESYFGVVCLFDQIKFRHGEEVARQMFADRANSWSLERLSPRDQENLTLLVHYYTMKKPRIKTLAKLLANSGRSGPRGTTNRKALERQIKRLLKDDRKAYKRARTNLLYFYVDVYGSELRFPRELLGGLEREPKPWETFSPD